MSCNIRSHMTAAFNGITDCTSNNTRAIYNRVSSRLNWIQGTTCLLTSNVSAVPVPCLGVVCSPGDVVRDWPTAPLPDGRWDAVTYGSFSGATLSQSPLPKTALLSNSITAVTITATNAMNETANCTWYVGVPPPKALWKNSSRSRPGKRKRLRKSSSPCPRWNLSFLPRPGYLNGGSPGRSLSFASKRAFLERIICTVRRSSSRRRNRRAMRPSRIRT